MLILLATTSSIHSYQNHHPTPLAEVTKNNFTREVSASKIPVIIAVVSTHSKTSQLLEPLLIELSKELADQSKVVIMNLDKNTAFLKEIGIVHAPVLILYNKGKKLGSIELNASTEEIKFLVKHILSLRILTSLNYYRIIMKLLSKIQ